MHLTAYQTPKQLTAVCNTPRQDFSGNSHGKSLMFCCDDGEVNS